MDKVTYDEFRRSKRPKLMARGIDVSLSDIHPKLFESQKYITKWALHKGRAAIFLDTGLGKTFCQLEWARLLNVPVLIVAPLSVSRQTVREAKKIDIDIKYIRHSSEILDNQLLYITNYEMIESVYSPIFKGIVLDESSILKSLDGKTKSKIIKLFSDTQYRLACTATPAPNDFIELGNHTEFLGVCKQSEMLAEWFIHANKVQEKILPNGNIYREKLSNSKGTEWRLRNYGKEHFFQWMTQWAMSMRKPSDLGFDDTGYILPPLNVIPHFVKADYKPEGKLFFDGLKGLQHRGEIREQTIDGKIQKAIELLNDEQWIIWCGLNEESSRISKLLPDAIEIKGSDSPEYKAEMIEAFQDGKYKYLITKGKIAGYGMNFQQSHNQIFIGLSDSWELFYQCIRRQYRFGQKEQVNVHIVLSDIEREIYNNVQRKEQIAQTLHQELIKNVALYEIKDLGIDTDDGIEYKQEIDFILPEWMKEIKNENNLSVPNMYESSGKNTDTGKLDHSSKILQSEMQRNSKNNEQKRADSECEYLLSELRESSENISESICYEKLQPKILQFEMPGFMATREEKSCMERRATLPEWLCSDMDA